jgi:hypothetical protein
MHLTQIPAFHFPRTSDDDDEAKDQNDSAESLPEVNNISM